VLLSTNLASWHLRKIQGLIIAKMRFFPQSERFKQQSKEILIFVIPLTLIKIAVDF